MGVWPSRSLWGKNCKFSQQRVLLIQVIFWWEYCTGGEVRWQRVHLKWGEKKLLIGWLPQGAVDSRQTLKGVRIREINGETREMFLPPVLWGFHWLHLEVQGITQCRRVRFARLKEGALCGLKLISIRVWTGYPDSQWLKITRTKNKLWKSSDTRANNEIWG